MNFIVKVNGRFLRLVLENGSPLVSDHLDEAVRMTRAQARSMAVFLRDEFGMKTAVCQLMLGLVAEDTAMVSA